MTNSTAISLILKHVDTSRPNPRLEEAMDQVQLLAIEYDSLEAKYESLKKINDELAAKLRDQG